MKNPVEKGSDDAPEDSLMADDNVDVNTERTFETWE